MTNQAKAALMERAAEKLRDARATAVESSNAYGRDDGTEGAAKATASVVVALEGIALAQTAIEGH